MHPLKKDHRPPDWSNPHAHIMARVNEIRPEELMLSSIQSGDVEYGMVSDLSLRYLGRIYQIHQQVANLQKLLEAESDVALGEPLITLVDSYERELEVVLGLFTIQLSTEHELRERWRGPPIFTIRKGGVAVIREHERRAHVRHLAQRPYRVPNPHTFYLAIALASVVGLQKKEEAVSAT